MFADTLNGPGVACKSLNFCLGVFKNARK